MNKVGIGMGMFCVFELLCNFARTLLKLTEV